MTAQLSDGNFTYTALDIWEQVPDGITLVECPEWPLTPTTRSTC